MEKVRQAQGPSPRARGAPPEAPGPPSTTPPAFRPSGLPCLPIWRAPPLGRSRRRLRHLAPPRPPCLRPLRPHGHPGRPVRLARFPRQPLVPAEGLQARLCLDASPAIRGHPLVAGGYGRGRPRSVRLLWVDEDSHGGVGVVEQGVGSVRVQSFRGRWEPSDISGWSGALFGEVAVVGDDDLVGGGEVAEEGGGDRVDDVVGDDEVDQGWFAGFQGSSDGGGHLG